MRTETNQQVIPAPVHERDQIAEHVREILRLLGEDTTRDGLVDTPLRVAKMYEEMLGGMRMDPESVLSATFDETAQGPVIVSDITFYSLCEHHMVPFFGKAHVAYLPSQTIVGISKIARLVDVFARRLQVQERMTEQIVDTIDRVLKPHGVMALIDAEHTCMCARGIRKPGSRTITVATRGEYQHNADLRREFLQMIGRG
ncbi:GTP cyclohydrolase I FolE [Alicyclobacillus macrosporangiidus]|jgi:GTP cyclohydrolase I|uniref:GTP cyclohydrolase 1 n=1 Tax=Alicyclobacillus macrosporangiidus TaxID=392015 RepID=A0A1I7FHV4_9BACL|nr:GTP cyclohydrolase I FolE [Alicyclobacillus macrosporangiidus]SFU35761.1 GTP cyclohydrolase I [Alicyclobacillus macrosporangiidus]